MEREFSVTPIITRSDSPEISMSLIYLKGQNRYVINPENTALYVCTRGSVTFIIGNESNHYFRTLAVGKCVIIPPHTPYLDFSQEGTTMLAINKIAFDHQKVIELPIPAVMLTQIKTRTLLTSL